VDSEVEALNLLDTTGSTQAMGVPEPTKKPTTGLSLSDVVRHEQSGGEIWLLFQNNTDVELA